MTEPDPVLLDQVVRWRMGAAHDARIADWRSQAVVFERPEALDFGQIGCFLILPSEVRMHTPPNASWLDPWRVQRLRDMHAGLVDLHLAVGGDLARSGIDCLPFVANVQDGTVFPLLETHPRETRLHAVQLATNRPVRALSSRCDLVLVPHGYQVLSDPCPIVSPVPWEKRDLRIFWRGQVTGMRYDYGVDDAISLAALGRPHGFASDFALECLTGKIADPATEARHYQRFRAALDYRDHAPDIDIGLTEPTDDRGLQLGADLNRLFGFDICKPRLAQEDYLARMNTSKLRLALPGNDIASSKYGDLLSDAAVLMPRPFHENYAHFGLEPGRHYVELAPDLGDLPQVLNWCRKNDAALRRIALEGQRHAQAILDPAFEREVQKRILLRLARNIEVI